MIEDFREERTLRVFSAVAAAFLAVLALPAAGRADGPSPAAPTAAMPAGPTCPCVRPTRAVRHHVWHHRRGRHHRWAAAPPPDLVANYNPLLPVSWDSAYDRAMTLHFRSPAVSGLYNPDPGYAPTPPVAGVIPYRISAHAGVYEYDGLTGVYVRLAQRDAARSGVAIAPPPPAPR